jgi:hypothetical protein
MIAAYLKQLSDALRFDPALSERVLQEVRDHLEQALAEEQLEDREEAERSVVERFGDPRALAAQFAPISLTRVTRRASIAIVLATVAVMLMMKARIFWYAFVGWTLDESARPLASFIVKVDRFAFLLAAAIAIASLLYLARYRTPVRHHASYRKHLHRTAALFILATIPLGVSVTGDLVLTALQLRSELSTAAVIPLASLSIEIGCLGAVAYLIVDAARRVASAEAQSGLDRV